ncbi:hypothetical protein HZ326_7623 [Fusarium oxysporum f. sp. albedinis]|nr:hypothetical protein HZ326_7623 [Fusarium oxysporum f. sp. albedinis]
MTLNSFDLSGLRRTNSGSSSWALSVYHCSESAKPALQSHFMKAASLVLRIHGESKSLSRNGLPYYLLRAHKAPISYPAPLYLSTSGGPPLMELWLSG